MRIDDTVCKLQIWDTAGQEKFKTLTTSYYKGSHAVVLVCDQTSYVVAAHQKSFEDIKRYWLPEVRANGDRDVKIVLLMNKSDMPNKEINYSEVKQFCDQEGMDLYETSAKTGKNVNTVFTDLCRHLMVVKGSGRTETAGRSLNSGSAEENDSGSCCN